MNNDFCPRNCEYLSLTEHRQDLLDSHMLHICLKYDVKLYHLHAHPDLFKCEQCYKETEA